MTYEELAKALVGILPEGKWSFVTAEDGQVAILTGLVAQATEVTLVPMEDSVEEDSVDPELNDKY